MMRLITASLFWRMLGLRLKRIIGIRPSEKSVLRCAVSLRLFLTNLGPIFIKFGQFLSNRPGLLREPFSGELRKLQASIDVNRVWNGGDFLKVHGLLDSGLEIEDKPAAIGSVAQVHRGKLASGEKVAVKFLRPGAKRAFHRDLGVIRSLLSFARFFIAGVKRKDLCEGLHIIKESAAIELNMSLEAASMDKMREVYKKHNLAINVPRVIWDMSRSDVLVMEWIDGISIDEVPRGSVMSRSVALKIAHSFFTQFHEEGLFHADLHSGNIKIAPNGEVYLIDFGIISYLPKKDRVAIAGIMYAFLNEDYDKVAEIHFSAGYVPSSQSRELFALTCRSIAKPILGRRMSSISMATLLKRLMSVIDKFDMNLQPQLILLQKTMISLEGIICRLDPELSMWHIARSWFTDSRRGRSKILNAFENIKHEVKDFMFDVMYGDVSVCSRLSKLLFDQKCKTKKGNEKSYERDE